MAASHSFKVYDSNNLYIASFKCIADAANFVNIFAVGGTVRWGHAKKHICWTADPDTSYDSYDEISIAAEEFLNGFGIAGDGSWLTSDIDYQIAIGKNGFYNS